VIEEGSVCIKRSAVGCDEFVEKILDQSQAFIILRIFPKDLNLENADKAFQLQAFSDSGDKIFA